MALEKSEDSEIKMETNPVSVTVSREKLINTAVEFLSSPTVQNASMERKTTFLKKKGLNDNEISVAISRSEEKLKQVIPMVYPSQELMPVVPYYPVTPWSRFRDILNTVVLVGGFMYGVYWAYRNIIFPYLFGKKQKKSIENRIEELDTTITNSVTEISNNIAKLSSSLEVSEKKNDSINKQIEELKSEVSSLKKLLLNRKQFPTTTPASGPVSIPVWQMVAARDKDGQEEEGNGSGTNGSDSSLEMIK